MTFAPSNTRPHGAARRMRHAFAIIALTGLLSACPFTSTSNGGTTSTGGTGTTSGIGPAGGTVTAADGASITVPANALSSTLSIAIAVDTGTPPSFPPSGVTAVSAIYAATPHGTSFALPVTVTIPYDTTKVAAGQTPVLYKAEVGGSFAPLSGTTVANGFISAQVSNFSDFAVGVSPATVQFSALAGTCGRDALSGKIYCWGDLSNLSNGTITTIVGPTLVAGGRAFGNFDVSAYGMCGLSGTELWCAGDNSFGILGDGTTTAAPDGVKVQAPAGVNLGPVSVSSSFACAIAQTSGVAIDGTVYCWGDNLVGQLGDGTQGSIAFHHTPQPIASTYRYVSVATGGGHGCAVRTTGEVDCWGENSYGQMGTGVQTSANQPTPTAVPGLSLSTSTLALSAGSSHTCGLKPNGDTVCWGSNYYGAIGDGTKGTGNYNGPNEVKAPTVVAGSHAFVSLRAGTYASCGLLATGETYCWGSVAGFSAPLLTPSLIDSTRQYQSLSAGVGSFCGIALSDHKVYCWGSNSAGAFGLGTNPSTVSITPVLVNGQ